jgi:hypothetical protein
LNSEIKHRGGRRAGAGRPPRPRPAPTSAEEAVYEAVRERVNLILGGQPAPSMDDVAGALTRLLERARRVQREARG